MFLTGQDEIETARRLLEEKVPKLPPDVPNLEICPIYAALAPEVQLKVPTCSLLLFVCAPADLFTGVSSGVVTS
jgi:hypothetical protein